MGGGGGGGGGGGWGGGRVKTWKFLKLDSTNKFFTLKLV